MAGPGLDIVVYFLSAFFTLVFFAISLIKLKKDNKLSYLNLVINFIGAIIITILLYMQLTKRN